MDVVLSIVALLLIVLGLIGSFLPILPGPPIGLLGLWVLQWTDSVAFSTNFWILMITLTVVSLILDYIVPIWGTKKFGGSKTGTRWATIGLVIGLFFGPIGIIGGPFIGAIVGELMIQRTGKEALKSGIWSLLGFALWTGFKFVVTGLMLWYAIIELL